MRKAQTQLFFLIVLAAFSGSCKQNNSMRVLPVYGANIRDTLGKIGIDHRVSDFKMVDQMGQTITLDTFKNKLFVANFFFASCQGVCIQMNNEMERVEKAFPGNDLIKFVSYTVTPDADSVPVLANYARQHNAVPFQWYFLRGDKTETLKLAHASYLLETAGFLVHSQNLTLVDKNRHIRGVYSGTVTSDVDRLIGDIKILLKE
jgi:protein SCO1/2